LSQSLDEVLHIAPAVWPGKPLKNQPGDLTRFVPSGVGLGAPAVMNPWDTLDSVMQRRDYYGFTPPSPHPFLNAPINDECGGVVYFDASPPEEQFDALLQLLRVYMRKTDYAAFLGKAKDVMAERYVEQLRLISKGAVAYIFGAEINEETSPLVTQNLAARDALWAFIQDQQATLDRSALRGTLGGDGDWAKETLGFGFMIENSYHGVYRIWSRPWLVTK
jgi:hypothetical protein